MKLRLIRLLAPFSLAGVLLFAPAITNTAQATVPGVDDELNDIQARIISGFAQYELSPKNDSQGSTPTSYSPLSLMLPRGCWACG